MTPIETLESRRMLSASLNATTGVLSVVGTPGPASISFALTADGTKVTAKVNGKTSTFAKAAVKSIFAKGGASNDSISVADAIKVPAALYADGVNAGPSATGEYLKGGGGNDTLVAAGRERGQVLYGGPGNDRLDLNNAPEAEAHGGLGDDKFVRVGSGLLYGDSGRDTADFSDKFTGRRIGNASTLQSQGIFLTDSDPILSGFENFNGTQGSDTIYGTDGDNVIYGNRGNDTIYGYGGRDAMFGNDGDDFFDAREFPSAAVFLRGGAGYDRAVYDGADTTVGIDSGIKM